MSIGKIDVTSAILNVKLLMETERISPAMKSALQLILLLVEILLNQRGLNSKNSSKPPSTDPNRIKVPKVKSDKNRGGQNGHAGTTLRKTDTPDKVEELSVDRGSLPPGDWRVFGYEPRQVFDLDISIVVTEYRAEILMNERGEKQTATFPLGVSSPVQYGNSVKAQAVYLSKYQLLPYKRIEEYFADQLALPLSAGTIDNFNIKAYEKLEWFDEFVRKKLISSTVLHADETGININGKRHWLHVNTSKLWTHLLPHAKRGKAAMDEMGVLPNYLGVLTHDHWKPYYKYSLIIHALCNAHHLRELESAYEQERQEWAKQMQTLLLAMNQDKIDSGGEIPPEKALEWRRQYRELLAEAGKECPAPVRSAEKKRGRLKRSKARNLLERLRDFEDDTLRFTTSKEIEFTNNEAEQTIRMTKVQQKISGCFRSFEGAEVYCRIRSYLSSAMKQGFSASYALKAMFEGRNIFLEKERAE